MVSCPRCKSQRTRLVRQMQNVGRYQCVKCKLAFFARECASPQDKSFHIWEHQGKERWFKNAMLDAGYFSEHETCSRFLFTDVDVPARTNRVEHQLREKNSVMFVYPHAARPFIGWDGLFQPSGYTAGVFVFAEGHKEVLRAYGYDKSLHTVGWAYSKINEFQPKELKRILFAPIHPNSNGWLSKLDKQINAATFDKVAQVAKDIGASVTVRHVKRLAENGISPVSGISYQDATTHIGDVESALLGYDLIVGHQTLAYTAVALGIPTLMMAEYEAPRNGNSDDKFKRVMSWDKYKHLMMYPLDILDTDDPTELALKACKDGSIVADWKRRMIGAEVFSAQKVVDVIQNHEKESK